MPMRCLTCDSPLASGPCCPRCAIGQALVGLEPAADADSGLPPAIPGYELQYELGRGSMGVVWLARDVALDRLVALKLILPGADPRLAARLVREGRAVGQLRHRHIVAVHARGQSGATSYLAMDFLAGGDLRSMLANGPLASRDAAQLVQKLADALAHAHAGGVLHRDLKPSNVLLDEQGEPHLADFGLAAAVTGTGDLTSPGQVAGTPGFLAPELLAGAEHASMQSDVYGLGAVLYACVAGRAPFVGETMAAVLARLASDEPPAPRLLNPGIARDLEVICLKCLEKLPAARYASAEALRDDLLRFLRGEPVQARPVSHWVKAARWCRRKPALAAVSGVSVGLVLVLAIGGPLTAWQMARARRATEVAREAATAAAAESREQLREALIARSRAIRLSGVYGQRHDALAAVDAARRIRPGLDVRNEAIAALALPDFVATREFALRDDLRDPVQFAPDHDRYAVVASGHRLMLRRLSDGALVRAFSGLTAQVRSGPRFSPDARFLVARDAADRVLVWSVDREDPLFVVSERAYLLRNGVSHYGMPDAVSPDGSILASAGRDGVVLHAMADGLPRRTIPVEAEPTHLVFSPDGGRLAVARGLREADGRSLAYVVIVDCGSGVEVCRLGTRLHFQTLAWDAGGRTVLLGGKRLEVFDARTGESLRAVSDPRATWADFGPAGTLVGSNQGGAVTLWDAGTARPLVTGLLGPQPEIAVTRDGRRIVKASGTLGRIYEIELSSVVSSVPSDGALGYDNVTNHGGNAVDWSDDGRWVATAAWGVVHVRDARTGRIVAEMPLGTSNNHTGVHFARDQRSLWCGSRELGLVRMGFVVPADGPPRLEPPETIDGELQFVLAAVAPRGDRAALVSMARNEVKVVGLAGDATGVRWKLPGAGRAVFLAGGNEVLANSFVDLGKAPLVVHDAADGRPLRTLAETHGYHVRTSGDGRWLVLGTGPQQSAVRRADDWQAGASLPEALQGAGRNAALSRDGTWLAAARGAIVALLRRETGEIVAQLETPRTGSYAPELAFSPDASRLAIYWENGIFTVWDLGALRARLGGMDLDW